MNGRAITMLAGGMMALATLFYILSTALSSWGHYGASGASFDVGLWRVCLSGGRQEFCGSLSCEDRDFGSDCTKLYGARAFMILACILSAISTLATFIGLLQSYGNPRVALMNRSLPAISLPCGVIGVALGIVFATTANFSLNVTIKISTAAIIGIIALIINLVAAVAATMIRPTNY